MGLPRTVGPVPMPIGTQALGQAAEAGDHASAVHRLALCKTREERVHWQRVLVSIELRRLAAKGRTEAQLWLPKDAGCSACRHRHLEIVPTSAAAESIIPADCPCMATRLCSLQVSGFIKRAP